MSASVLNGAPLGGIGFGSSGTTAALTELFGTAEAAGSLAGVFVYAHGTAAIAARAQVGASVVRRRPLAAAASGRASTIQALPFVRRQLSASAQLARALPASVAPHKLARPTAARNASALGAGSAQRRRLLVGAASAQTTRAANFYRINLMFGAVSARATGSQPAVQRGLALSASPAPAQASPLALATVQAFYTSSIQIRALGGVASSLAPRIYLASAIEAMALCAPVVPLPGLGFRAVLRVASQPLSATRAIYAVGFCNAEDYYSGPTPPERVMVSPYENREMEANTMALLGTFKKQPADKLDYAIDFSGSLPEGDAISNATVTIDQAGLTQHGEALVNDRTVKVWFSAGTNGTTYKVTVTATSTQGRIKQNEFRIKVKDI